MAYFAKVENGIVVDIIVAEQDVINSGLLGDPSLFVETFKDTYRGNYASIGGVYDKQNDVFYMAQPFPSWTLNTTTWTWECPVKIEDKDIPNDLNITQDNFTKLWDEKNQQWLCIVKPENLSLPDSLYAKNNVNSEWILVSTDFTNELVEWHPETNSWELKN